MPNLAGFGRVRKATMLGFARTAPGFSRVRHAAAPGLKIVGSRRRSHGQCTHARSAHGRGFFDGKAASAVRCLFLSLLPGSIAGCAPPDNPMVGTSRDQALTDAWFERTDRAFKAHRAVRDHHGAGSSNLGHRNRSGGLRRQPVGGHLPRYFTLSRSVGTAPRQGVSASFTTPSPERIRADRSDDLDHANYWRAALASLDGPVVLDVGQTRPGGLHVYAQCLRDGSAA